MDTTPHKRLVAFFWYGGKNRPGVLKWLLDNLPMTNTYIEPFGGSAAILLNRTPSPVEVFNDIDGGVVNFFKVLREQPEVLIEQIRLTPFAREELALSLVRDGNPVEDARRFYVSTMQSIGSTRGGWVVPAQRALSGEALSHLSTHWKESYLEGSLPGIARRLRGVFIEHGNALDCITRYDSPETLFYIDPPYLVDPTQINNGYYGTRWAIGDDLRLSETLNQVKGKVAISGYAGHMQELYQDWRLVEGPKYRIVTTKNVIQAALQGTKDNWRQELLWCNYPEGEEKDGIPI